MNEFNYMARLETAEVVRELVPEMAALAQLDRSGVIVTAAGARSLSSTRVELEGQCVFYLEGEVEI